MARRAMCALLGAALAAGSLAAVVMSADVVAARAESVTCPPDAGYTNCLRLTYTGADQTVSIPTGITSIVAKVWGAGGGGVDAGYYNGSSGGGGGGFTSGTLAVTGGQALTVVVGGAGLTGASGSAVPTYGGGGIGGQAKLNDPRASGSTGGGMSGVFTAAPSGTSALLVAGGGGGASPGADQGPPTAPRNIPFAGGGGGVIGGADKADPLSGRGATATAKARGATGIDGCVPTAVITDRFQGGSGSTPKVTGVGPSEGGGGGGGGWFGGGAGKCQSSASKAYFNGAGGGGSGYVNPTITDGQTSVGQNAAFGRPGTYGAAAGNTDPQYVAGVGNGGAVVAGGGDGGAGMVVLEWNRAFTVSIAASAATVTVAQKLIYTVTLTNASANGYGTDSPAGVAADLSAALDDATYAADAVSSLAGWSFALTGATLSANGPLPAGATVTITFSVVVKAVGLGDAALTASVTPTAAGGACVVGECTVTTAGPTLVLLTTATPTVLFTPQPVVFTFTVTNYGAATLTDLNILDALTTPASPPLSFVCLSITLAPRASTTCTGTYSVTNADVAIGQVLNAATATASPTDDTATVVRSNPSSVAVATHS